MISYFHVIGKITPVIKSVLDSYIFPWLNNKQTNNKQITLAKSNLEWGKGLRLPVGYSLSMEEVRQEHKERCFLVCSLPYA